MLQAWRFPAGPGGPDPLDLDAALVHLAHGGDAVGATGATGGGGAVWIDLDLTAPGHSDPSAAAALRAVDDVVGLGEFLLEDLREGVADAGQRTKLQQHGTSFHVAVRDCGVAAGRLVEREVDLVFGDGWLLSVRHPPVPSTDPDPDPFPVDEVRRRLAVQHTGVEGPDEGLVLWAFLDVVTDRYLRITDAVDERLDEAERILLDDGDDGLGPRPTGSRELFDTGRLLTDFRHQVIPLREVLAALLRRDDPHIGDRALAYLRDVYDHLLGLGELVESQRDVLAGLRDVHLTVVSNRMNRSMQQLAAWGAILIVATLITGILGMNFRDAPDLSWHLGFGVVVVVIAVVTVPMWWFFRRRRWL